MGAAFFPHATKVKMQVRHKNKEIYFFHKPFTSLIQFFAIITQQNEMDYQIKSKIFMKLNLRDNPNTKKRHFDGR